MTRVIGWFGENPVAANLLMFMLIFSGLATLPGVQQKPFPDIDIDVIQIAVPFLGAAPAEVEEGVCIRIEEEIQGIEGIEKITSSAAEGACGVSAELIQGYPKDRALTEIKNAVDGITTFPDETEKPVVSQIIARRNAIKIALSGDAPESTLKAVGEQLRDEIAALPDVTQVTLNNTRRYEISVEVSEHALQRYGLTFDDVVRAVRLGSLDRPGGSIKAETGEILLRTKGQAYTGADFAEIVVLTREDGTRLMLPDVARIVDGFEEDASYARFDGEPAVLVQVYRVGEQRIIELTDKVKAYVAEVSTRLPEGLHFTVWQDGSKSLRDRLDIMLRNGRGGFILVFIVLSIFLRFRLAFWVSIGVPVAMLAALALFPPLDLSVDVISVFAFILVLGLLVDDAIVVAENVHSHQENAEEPREAAIRGAQEVSVPVIFGVLTTVAAFLPMVFAPGIMGQIFGTIGVVVICCLFFSVVESQLVLPSHLSHMKIASDDDTKPPTAWKRFQARAAGALTKLARQRYRPALERLIAYRYATVATCFVALMIVVAVVATERIKFSFFPPLQGDRVSASVTMPQGTPSHVTAAAVRELEAAARRTRARVDAEFPLEEGSIVRHVLASIGQQPSTGSGPPGTREVTPETHLGEITLELAPADVRPVDASYVTQIWREETPAIPDLEELTFQSSLFHAGDAINIELQASSVTALEQAAEDLKVKLAEYPGVFDITDSFRSGKDEIQLDILPAAETLGVTLDDLSRQVRQAFYGAEAQRIQRGRDDIKVMIRYPASERRSLADLENMRVRTADGGEVPFYAVAKVSKGRGFSTIKRADRQRVINVIADIDLTEGNANQVLSSLQAGFMKELAQRYPGLSYRLEGEQREQRKAFSALRRNYMLAMALVYVLLAIPLKSYVQPLIIMAVIPFGLVGAIAGHFFMRLFLPMNLSMMSVFGVVALSGVVVNDSLVLVHYINKKRAEGATIGDAVREAGVARFRPILLTSITTFAGLTPLLLERSVTAQFLIPMATSLAFGVIFATVISLVMVPCLYIIIDDIGSFAGRILEKIGGPQSPRVSGVGTGS